MNSKIKHCFLIVLVLKVLYSCSTEEQPVKSTFNYQEQVAPDSIPVIFGNEMVSVKGRFEMGFTISSDGSSMAFGVADESNPEETCIYLMHYQNGKWTSPDKSLLPDNINTFFPMFTSSGKELYYAKSIDGYETDLWVARFSGNKAVNVQPLDSTINSKSREAGHGLSKNGAFYFTSNRDDQNQCCGDIYYTPSIRGGDVQIQKAEILSSEADEESLYLSPDEEYIIIQAWKNEYESKHDLYISYRTKEGSWTIPDRLKANINSSEIEQRPFVSSDNKHLFFSRMSITKENGQDVYESDIYWVSTKKVFSPFVYNNAIEGSVKYAEKFEIELPKDLFKDINDQALTYKLTQADDVETPEWVKFDPERFVLNGTWKTRETLQLKITATDVAGNSGKFEFELKEEII